CSEFGPDLLRMTPRRCCYQFRDKLKAPDCSFLLNQRISLGQRKCRRSYLRRSLHSRYLHAMRTFCGHFRTLVSLDPIVPDSSMRHPPVTMPPRPGVVPPVLKHSLLLSLPPSAGV